MLNLFRAMKLCAELVRGAEVGLSELTISMRFMGQPDKLLLRPLLPRDEAPAIICRDLSRRVGRKKQIFGSIRQAAPGSSD